MKKLAWLVVAAAFVAVGAIAWLLAEGGPNSGASGDPDPAAGASKTTTGTAGAPGEGGLDRGAPGARQVKKLPPRPATGESTVTGRVIDAASRSGIARARLVLRHPRGEYAVTAESAGDGAFTLAGVPGVLGARLFVVADGFGPKLVRDLNVPPHDRLDLGVIELERGFAIAGRVVTAAGAPIGEAQVALVESASSRPGFSEDLVQIFRDLREDDEALDEVSTAVDGTFTFAAAAPGAYVLVARKPGWQVRFSLPVTVGGPDALPVVELRLTEARRLRGVVTEENSGKPIAGARVAALEVDPNELVFPKSQKTVTGADGRFGYSTFGDGQVALIVEAAGYSGASLGNLEAGGKDVEIKLKKAARIEGRVFDRATGKGLSGASVVAFRLDEDVALEETQSGPDGVYAMETGPSGTNVGVFAKLAGYTMADVADAMMSGENDGGEKLLKPENEFAAGTTVRRDLPMLGGATLSGRVVDHATGQGIVSAEIMVRPLIGVDFIAFADPVVTRSGAEGAFTAAPIGVGKFSVTANANGYVAMGLPTPEGEEDPPEDERATVEIRSGGAAATVSLRLRRGAEIIVSVTDPDGQPLAGASVSWMIPDERLVELFGPRMRPRAVATDSAGKAVIASLPPRDAILFAARHPDYPAGGHVTIPTVPLPDKPVLIAVVRAASLAGVIIGADGRPAAGREVHVTFDNNSVPRAFGEWSWMVHRAATDAAGRFLIEKLPPGSATVGVGGGMIARNRPEDAAPPDDEILADPAQASIELRSGKREEISLRLIRTQPISGRVTDASGRALAGVLIHATASPGQSVQGEFWAQSEEDGAYRIGGLAPGSYQVEAILNMETGPKKQTRAVTAGTSGVDFRME